VEGDKRISRICYFNGLLFHLFVVCWWTNWFSFVPYRHKPGQSISLLHFWFQYHLLYLIYGGTMQTKEIWKGDFQRINSKAYRNTIFFVTANLLNAQGMLWDKNCIMFMFIYLINCTICYVEINTQRSAFHEYFHHSD